MSREFSKISPKVWRSIRFRALPTDDARYLLMYLLTSPHQTSAGCFRMPDAYGAADMGWSVEQFRQARTKLVEAGLLAFDADTEDHFVRGWFVHNKPMNASHQKAIVRLISEIESDDVREVAETEFEPAMLASTREVAESHRLMNTTFMSNRRP